MIVVKIKNVVYDEKPLQQAVSQETTIWATHEGRDNNVGASKLLSEVLAVDVKINEKDKALILLSSFHRHTMLYGKEPLILEEATSTLLFNEIRKRPNQEEQRGSGLVVTGRKGREGKKGSGFVKGVSLLSQGMSLEE